MSQFNASNISNQSIQFTYSGSTIFMPSGISSASFKVTGSDLNTFIEKSASVILELDPISGKHLQFRTPSASLGTSDDKVQFFISNSATPKIGIGTNNPLATLDIVDVEDSAEGFVFLIRNARTVTKGGDPGDAAGTINFVITSGSYDKIDTSGSVGKITSEVDAVSTEGVGGHIRFEVSDTKTSNLSNDPVEVLRLLKDSTDTNDYTAIVTGSLRTTKNISAFTGFIEAGDYINASNYLRGDSLKIGVTTNPGSGNAIILGDLKVTNITGSIISASGAITGSDVYINDWGSVSASLAAAGGGGAVATYTNGVDNRVITSTGTDSINGESNLTFDGSKLLVSGSGSTLLEVVGSEGQLFSITDSLSGSLFAVSDVSGLPILEVFSDDTVKIGTFNDEAITVNGNTAAITGSFTGSFEGTRHFEDNPNTDADILFIGNTTTTQGLCYFLTGSGWVLTNANTPISSSGLLAIAKGTNSTTDGMIVRGVASLSGTPSGAGFGNRLYLRAGANGALIGGVPSTSGYVVRMVGYSLDTSKVWFDPSNDYIQLA